MSKVRIVFLALAGIFVIGLVQSCQAVKTITQTLTNLQKLQFKLANVSGVKLAGIDVAGKSSISDFSLGDGLALTRAFAEKKLPATFTLNVAAKNPNTGKNGVPSVSATLAGLDWRLLIDGKQTVSGNITSPVEIPGNGQESIVPLGVNLDLYQFFADQGYQNIVNLALAIAGAGGTSRLTLDAQPSVTTQFGKLDYPGRITIIDKEYR